MLLCYCAIVLLCYFVILLIFFCHVCRFVDIFFIKVSPHVVCACELCARIVFISFISFVFARVVCARMLCESVSCVYAYCVCGQVKRVESVCVFL